MLLVRSVRGPAQAATQTTAVYRATSFNRSDPTPEERGQINWLIRSDESTVAELQAHGERLEFEVPESLLHRSIQVMPFLQTPTLVVSVTTRIVDPQDVVEADREVAILSREEWGARTDLPRLGSLVDRVRRTAVFFHHTVIVEDDTSPNEWETLDAVKTKMRQLQTIRRQDLGADVPYSMVAFCMANGDLVLAEGRGLDRTGAHARRHNASALGIALQGNFESLPLPTHFDAQLAALGNHLRQLHEQEGFVNLGAQRPWGREVFAHRDVSPTACPGAHLFAKLDLVRFL